MASAASGMGEQNGRSRYCGKREKNTAHKGKRQRGENSYPMILPKPSDAVYYENNIFLDELRPR